MKDIEFEVKKSLHESAKDFYLRYEWCLNPILTLDEQFQHLDEEISGFDALESEWQREESRINLYLFCSSIACTIDDYISHVPVNLFSLTNKYPRYRTPIILFQFAFNLPHRIKSYGKMKEVIKFREIWNTYLDLACKILLGNKNLSSSDVQFLFGGIEQYARYNLPYELRLSRMKINEGFRCQDLTHHDVITLANKFLKNNLSNKERIIILGPRTAGAYFAPLLKNYFELLGYNNVASFTIRPKKGISQYEKKRLKRLITTDARVILTDDYSNTGQSFRLMQSVVNKFGISGEQISILAPIHPAKSTINLAIDKRTKVLKLNHNELFKEKFLNSHSISDLINEYFSKKGLSQVFPSNNFVNGYDEAIQNIDPGHLHFNTEDSRTGSINSELKDQLKDGFQVRLKRLYEAKFQNKYGEVITTKIIGKSVGWGWLGYHAFIAGSLIQDFVPEVINLRNGILFMNWIDGEQVEIKSSGRYVDVIASYIAERTSKLRLKEDPKFYPPYTGWGWLEILSILRRPFGVLAGRIMNNALLKLVERSATKKPTLIDGKMQPVEWIQSNGRAIKIDFEQHNFGAPNFDVADPAYDLAGASFEFNLSKEDEKSMLSTYGNKTGDKTIFDRFILYKLLYANIINKKTHEEILESIPGDNLDKINERFIQSWSCLIYTMNSFCAGAIKSKTKCQDTDKLFFLDLDGVLDTEVFGFQHTTLSGMYALALLAAGGFSVIPNTGRSIEHVRNYCKVYGFEAGIAEYGSVILADKNKTEIPLIDIETVKQLNACRKSLKKIKGVFVDPNYKYSVRAYKYSAQRTGGLSRKEAEDLLRIFNLDKLRVIVREDDTYFIGRENNKGNALMKLKEYFQLTSKPVYAIGDSEEDIPMLESSEFGFAPSNCTKELRQSPVKDKIKITSNSFQNGFLQAAKEVSKHYKQNGIEQLIEFGEENSVHRLIIKLLKIADQSKATKLFYLLFKKNILAKNSYL